jgi:anti-sigma-K factor RskA
MMRRTIYALSAAVVVSGAVFAMAASLGGITSDNLGADSAAVATCDNTGVSTSYTTAYDATDGRYEVTAVTVSGIDNACDGKAIAVTLTNGAGASVGSGSTTVPTDVGATAVTVTLSSAASAEDAANAHVLIS